MNVPGDNHEILMKIACIKTSCGFVSKWLKRNHKTLIVYELFKVLMTDVTELENLIKSKATTTSRYQRN
jgi:hypothetical protein